MTKWFLCIVAFLFAAASPGWAFEAGASKVEITPPLGTPLCGYFDRLGRGALSVHDPVWVRCLYLDDGQTKVFILTSDLCGISRELREAVLAKAPDVAPRENIILTATHTHSAQGAMMERLLFRTVSGRYMPEIVEMTASKFAEAMKTAYESRKRATIGYATTTQKSLSRNRRVEGGVIDEQIGAIRVNDSDGEAIAIVGSFAAHPTSVSGKDMLSVSADYPGYYYNEVEALSNPGCVAMFMQGTAGNQTCGNPEQKEGWDRTESIGKLLAGFVKGAANDIKSKEATLRVASATVATPPTLGGAIMPSDAFLQILEIDDLLLTFIPGEACVEIGLGLRQRAIEWGYSAQFSVGLSNDYLGYFIPKATYNTTDYESAMNFYGPAVENWFYDNFAKLCSRGKPESARAGCEPGQPEDFAGARKLTLKGTPYQIGYARGAAFGESIQTRFRQDFVEPCDAGTLIPDSGMWSMAPSFVNLTPLALPRLGMGARPLLTGLDPAVFEEVEGLADGAGLAFDAAWLVQCAPTYAAHGNTANLYRSPFCTMFAVTGLRAGADDILVGRNFDWSTAEEPLVADMRPETGHRFVQVGFSWSVGAFTGMNDAGLVVCAERVESQGVPTLDGPPVELVLRQVLQGSGSTKEALAQLGAAKHLKGYHVLVADSGKGDACVMEFGTSPQVRKPAEGILLGVDPNSQGASADAKARYARISELLQSERIVATPEIQVFLCDRQPGQTGQASVFNDMTRHSVVFEPKAKRLRVAFPMEDGSAGEFVEISLEEAEQ